uniref:Uncharacterized protein n=1 Tax=Physcomitrium patens TaxID=3218 RepID=A0A2K1ID53_PHYPA|nr:hypothetical protein PHYPA_030685 [Physcomitrium patens]
MGCCILVHAVCKGLALFTKMPRAKVSYPRDVSGGRESTEEWTPTAGNVASSCSRVLFGGVSAASLIEASGLDFSPLQNKVGTTLSVKVFSVDFGTFAGEYIDSPIEPPLGVLDSEVVAVKSPKRDSFSADAQRILQLMASNSSSFSPFVFLAATAESSLVEAGKKDASANVQMYSRASV